MHDDLKTCRGIVHVSLAKVKNDLAQSGRFGLGRGLKCFVANSGKTTVQPVSGFAMPKPQMIVFRSRFSIN